MLMDGEYSGPSALHPQPRVHQGWGRNQAGGLPVWSWLHALARCLFSSFDEDLSDGSGIY